MVFMVQYDWLLSHWGVLENIWPWFAHKFHCSLTDNSLSACVIAQSLTLWPKYYIPLLEFPYANATEGPLWGESIFASPCGRMGVRDSTLALISELRQDPILPLFPLFPLFFHRWQGSSQTQPVARGNLGYGSLWKVQGVTLFPHSTDNLVRALEWTSGMFWSNVASSSCFIYLTHDTSTNTASYAAEKSHMGWDIFSWGVMPSVFILWFTYSTPLSLSLLLSLNSIQLGFIGLGRFQKDKDIVLCYE